MKKNKKKNKKASVLIVSLLILGAVITIALSLAAVALRERKTSISSSRSQVAYQMADEGVETVMNAFLKVNVGTGSRISYLGGGTNPDGVLTINSVIGQRIASCPQASAVCCKAADGLIYGPDNIYVITLLDANDQPLFCNDGNNDISAVRNIKSVGYDTASQTTRAVKALVDQKDPYLKLFLDMDGTGSSAPQDISRMHDTVEKSSSPSPNFEYDTSTPHNYGFSSLHFKSNGGYFVINKSTNDNLSKDLTFKFNSTREQSSAGFSIDFWIKRGALGEDYTQSIISLKTSSGATKEINLALVHKSGAGNVCGIRLTTSGFSIATDNMAADFFASSGIDNNTFHHIAFVRDSGTSSGPGPVTVYIDGKKANKLESNNASCDPTSNMNCPFTSDFIGDNSTSISIGGPDTDPSNWGPIGQQEALKDTFIDLLRIGRITFDTTTLTVNGHTPDNFTSTDMREFYK